MSEKSNMLSSSEKSPLLVRSSDTIARNPNSIDTSGNNEEPSETEGNSIGDTGITNKTVIALAFTVFVQSYLLEGVFPYAGFLTMHLFSSENKEQTDFNVNEETVGKYAGYIACSFMVGRTITAILWGRIADAYGRVFVLELSLVASAITSLGFGFASTYREALLWRFLMGVGNGITGTIKCLLSEIKESSGSEQKETKTMAIVYGMRGYGFLLCPAITGFLSDPMKQYPESMASTPSCVQSLLLAYPFVLPNLVAFFLCWAAFRLVRNHVEETLPEEGRQPFFLFRVLKSEVKEHILPNSANDKIENIANDINGSKNAETKNYSTTADLLWHDGSKNRHDTNAQRLQRQRISGRWFHLYIYWMFSFLNIASDELFPLFCLSKVSGLGLYENQISSVLGGTTIIYGLFQYFLLTGLVQKLGLYPTLRIGTFGSVPPSILIPIGSLWLVSTTNGNVAYSEDPENSNKLTPVVALYLCTMIAATKCFCSVVFSTITMATNRTVDTIDQRATLNGIASLGGSFAKACGPVFAGTLFSFLAGDADALHNNVIEPPYGAIVSYSILSVLGFLLAVQTICLRSNPSQRSINIKKY